MNVVKPIIVIGAPRSGTSLLGDVLSDHPDVIYFIEPTPVWRKGNEHRCDMFQPEHASDEVCRYIRQYFERELARSSATRMVEKTPQNSLRMAFIEKIFPDARFVHIIRNGVESTLSIKRMWESNTKGFRGVRVSQRMKELSPLQIPKYGVQFLLRVVGQIAGKRTVNWGPLIPGVEAMVRDLGILHTAAYQWRYCIELALMHGRQLPPERYLECRLEELNESKFSEILDFCELPLNDEVLGKFSERFSKDKIKSHGEEISAEELELIKRLIEPTEKVLG